MEEAKPSMPTPTATTSSNSHSESGGGGETLKEYSEAIEVRFTEFCKNGLSWDENMSMEAIKLFRDTKHLLLTNISAIGNTAEEAERFWFSFVSYAVKRLSKKKRDNLQQKSDHNGVMFFQILRLAKLNIVDFFKELPQFLVMAGPILSNRYGADWESRLEAKELLANFEHLGILSRFYKRACQELFLTTNGTVDKPAVSGDSSFVLEYQRFGWLLFLALRAHAFGRLKDLLTCRNGLVSILDILIIHVPAHFRNFRFGDSQWFVKKDDKGIDLLASLCNKYDTSKDELRKTLAKTNSLIGDILKKKPRSASELKNENTLNINTDGLIYYEDWMEESSLQSSLDILEKDYDDSIHNNGGELDERVFINEEDSLLGSGGSKEKEKELQHLARPLKQATSSKKRKLPSEAENGGVGGSVGEKSEDFDFSLAQLKDKISRVKKNQMDIDVERLAGPKKMVKFDGSSFCVDMEDYVMKKGLELLDDETRAEIEEVWKKLKAEENKLHLRKLALLEWQLMDCCLSDHSSSLEEEEEHKGGKTSNKPAK